jgi:integrase
VIVHGKGGKQRVVPIGDGLADEIRAFRSAGYLFPGRCDGHIKYRLCRAAHLCADASWMVATTERYTAVTDPEVREKIALFLLPGYRSASVT